MLMCVLPVELIAEPDLGEMERFVAKRFACRTLRLDPLPLPAEAHDTHRGQYDAATIMRSALAVCPASATRLLAVTERDLFVPMLTFIFGQAQVDGKAALLSLLRLRQEYYGLPPRPDLFAARLRKETLHELGHTFGLYHCTDAHCAMALSINIADIDIKKDELCGNCAVRLEDQIADLGLSPGATEG